MQTIETKYVGATNTRGSRIVATASGSGMFVRIPYDSGQADENMHMTAAIMLCNKLGWEGKMVAGHTKHGMVWVFDELLSPRFQVGGPFKGRMMPHRKDRWQCMTGALHKVNFLLPASVGREDVRGGSPSIAGT